MSEIHLNYDERVEDCSKSISLILTNLKVPHEVIDSGTGIDIIYKTPKEVADEGIPVPLELEESVLIELMQMAHEKNLTFNQFCNDALREQIKNLEIIEKSKKSKKG